MNSDKEKYFEHGGRGAPGVRDRKNASSTEGAKRPECETGKSSSSTEGAKRPECETEKIFETSYYPPLVFHENDRQGGVVRVISSDWKRYNKSAEMGKKEKEFSILYMSNFFFEGAKKKGVYFYYFY